MFKYIIPFIFVLSSVTYALCAEQTDEEVTIVESLDLSDWMTHPSVLPDELLGLWETESLGNIEIIRLPVSENSCLVKLNNRMVPAFQVNVADASFLVVGTHATESLCMNPIVYRYNFEKDGGEVQFYKMKTPEDFRVMRGIDSFIEFVKTRVCHDDFIATSFKRVS